MPRLIIQVENTASCALGQILTTALLSLPSNAWLIHATTTSVKGSILLTR